MEIEGEKPMIAWNPLEVLASDEKVRNLFTRLLFQRIDTTILSNYFGLTSSPGVIQLPGKSVTKSEFVQIIVDSLVSLSSLNPIDAAQRFWSQFKYPKWRFSGVPKEIRPTLGEYFKIKEDVTDLLMFVDIIDSGFIKLGTVVDIGCGRNKLGRSLLKYSDAGPRTLTKVIGTDINAYKAKSPDRRLIFKQQSGTALPLENDTVDIAIVKWALHHMTHEEIHSLTNEIHRILRPGGRLSIVEGLVGEWSVLKTAFDREQKNPDTWPSGPWIDRRVELTHDYLILSEEQQIQVLALEDFNGHWLEQEFTWMPLPFNYMNTTTWTRIMSKTGLQKDDANTRLFGMSPIIHWGPPSVRLVFIKEA
jgi:SAM-dependent methyltransferase